MDEQKASIIKKIDIAEIKDGVVLMKDKSLRGVLMVSSVNFALKSTEEQDAITYRYQEFLNSLDFPIQILIINRRFDISGYLGMLEQKRIEQENELLRIQTSEYIEFIRGLTGLVNVMSVFFYIVVPYAQSAEKKITNPKEKITQLFKKGDKQVQHQTYEQMRAGLWQRMEYISTGLAAIGLKSVVLNNDELLELFYKMYNPEAKEKPTLKP